MEKSELKPVLEAMIFASDKPLGMNQAKEVLEGADETVLRQAVEELNQEYLSTGRSFCIQEVAGGYKMATKPEFAPWLKTLYKNRLKERLTKPSLETLAIIAYKQPATKAEIEAIRGVNVDGVVTTLLEKNLVKISGRKDVIGRPILYSTTDEFLAHFGLASLADMPGLPEVEQLTQPVLPSQAEIAVTQETVQTAADSPAVETQVKEA